MKCENCGETKPKSSILIHIAKKKECLDFYGPKFLEMKSEKNRKKVKKHYQNHSAEKLKSQREAYAKNPQRRKMYYKL